MARRHPGGIDPNPEAGEPTFADAILDRIVHGETRELLHHDILGGKVYIAQAREPGKKIWRVTIGRHDVLNADRARQRAAFIIARIRAGEEPVPLPLAARFNGGPTVADLADNYLEEHAAVRLKARTQLRVCGMLQNHILPALGRLPLEAIERSHVVEFHQKLSDRPVTANKSIKVLPHMYRLGEGWGLVPEGFNPCRSVEKYPERSRERFLTYAEFARLGRVLDEAVKSGAAPLMAVTAIRLLMLTGCRKSEILTLRWSDVDLDAGELHLADSKTGPRAVQLTPTAVELLDTLPRRKDSPWVFPGNDRDGRYSGGGLDHAWRTLRAAARLEDVRLHDLRHSCASWPDFLAAKEVIKRCNWLSFSLLPKPPDIAIYNPKSHSHRIHSNI